jgi:purine-binding chemotaxis protein CheW
MSLAPRNVQNSTPAYIAGQVAVDRSVFTVVAAGEMLGIPIASVRTIFRAQGITPIPLAPAEVLGLVNLRGKIVTAVSLRTRLGLERAADHGSPLAVGLEHRGEDFALVVDEVREVVPLPENRQIPIPANMHVARAGLVREVHQIDDRILTVLDLDALLEFSRHTSS